MSAGTAFLGAAEGARLLARGEISSEAWVGALLARIERLDPKLNAWSEVLTAAALDQAAQASRERAAGRVRGPLHGVPVAIKDLVDVAGAATVAGARPRDPLPAARDAHVVDRLRRAGAVVIGKTRLHELAFGITNDNPHHGPTRNPWRLDRVPGGSSGGSGAALAAGTCPLAIGTDTGGSIRVPAAACGVTGLKPTFGRVGRSGVQPLAWSLDHVGPMARSVEDAALMLDAIAGPDPGDAAATDAPPPRAAAALEGGVSGLTLGVAPELFAGLEPDVASAVEAAIAELAALGARRAEVAIPWLGHAYTAFHALLASEAAAIHGARLRERPADLGDDVRRGLELGSLIAAADLVHARRMQSAFAAGLGAVLARVDLLATPSLPRAAPPIGEPMTREPAAAWNRFLAPFNLAGVPALSVPCGFDRDGLPIGLQLVGRWLDEATVLRAGHAFQRATDWHQRRPPEPFGAPAAAAHQDAGRIEA